MKVQKILLDALGGSYGCIVEGSGDHKHYYNEKKITLNETLELVSTEKVLDKGVSEFPFSFKIPLDVKSTFKTSNNFIMYQLRAKVDIPWGKDAESENTSFHVNNVVDLNDDTDTLAKGEEQYVKTYSCCCMSQGTVSANLVVNKTGFVSGEVIKVDIKVENSSTELIKHVHIQLIQLTAVEAQGHHKTVEKKIGEIKALGAKSAAEEIPPGENREMQANITIPKLPPSQEDQDLIMVSYKLRILPVPDSMFFVEEGAEVKITIGNIPHKIAMAQFEAGTSEMPANVKAKYPSLPNYTETRDKYVSFTDGRISEPESRSFCKEEGEDEEGEDEEEDEE